MRAVRSQQMQDGEVAGVAASKLPVDMNRKES